jgi:hypothetical protein
LFPVIAHLSRLPVGDVDVLLLVVGVGGVLCENCIVDASIFIFCVPHIPVGVCGGLFKL